LACFDHTGPKQGILYIKQFSLTVLLCTSRSLAKIAAPQAGNGNLWAARLWPTPAIAEIMLVCRVETWVAFVPSIHIPCVKGKDTKNKSHKVKTQSLSRSSRELFQNGSRPKLLIS